MKEIKFRVWDSKYGELNYESALEILLNNSLGTYNKGVYEKYKFVFMQYTGAKDKNGVEIYEGDIIRVVGGEEHYGNRELDITGVLIQENLCWIIQDKYNDNYGVAYLECAESYEVLGNIHENKELLEA